MSFRDDHDAALARADALERELAATRAKLETAEAALEAQRAKPPVVRDRWRVRLPRVAMLFWMCFSVAVLSVVAALAARSHFSEPAERHQRYQPPPVPVPGPTRISVTDGLGRAQELVELAHGTSRLESISASSVDPAGVVHLDYNGSARYRFRLAGGPQQACAVTHVVDQDGWEELVSHRCEPLPELAPRCDFAGVWLLAIERGTTGNSLASIEGTRDADGVLTWRFATIDGSLMNQIELPDDCPGQ